MWPLVQGIRRENTDVPGHLILRQHRTTFIPFCQRDIPLASKHLFSFQALHYLFFITHILRSLIFPTHLQMFKCLSTKSVLLFLSKSSHFGDQHNTKTIAKILFSPQISQLSIKLTGNHIRRIVQCSCTSLFFFLLFVTGEFCKLIVVLLSALLVVLLTALSLAGKAGSKVDDKLLPTLWKFIISGLW